MKTIGLIGGMSWESSLEYYRLINQMVMKQLGVPHSAKIVMDSVDFAEIEQLQHQAKWNELTEIMILSAQKLERAGADLVLICTNTMHKMANQVQKAIQRPLIHIADATAMEIQRQKFKKVALLGTKFTMEGDFYAHRIQQNYGIEVIIPTEVERNIVHQIIYNELVAGIFSDSSKQQYRQIICNLKNKGAQGVILGCTEIPLLIKPYDSCIPVFDTTWLHARSAVQAALG